MLLITGMSRSGTTLLEKLIHNHPKAAIASQPYPLIYSSIKELYLDEIGQSFIYPMGNYFLDESGGVNNFYDFLSYFEIDKEFIISTLNKMKNYSGQWTPSIFDKIELVLKEKSNFVNYYIELINKISNLFENKDKVNCVGSKEVYCEEYLPFLLENIDNFKAIIIIRDPRDVITSLNCGDYEKSSGKRRPILFDIRNWRKSIAFSILLKDNPNVKIIRYENLIKNHNQEIIEVFNFLGLSYQNDNLDKEIKDQQGMKWMGNSSFGNKNTISNDSIGRYKEQLSSEIVSFIETTCYFEMKYLGFDFSKIDKFDEKFIYNFKEPFNIERDAFTEYYKEDLVLKEQEIDRYNNVFKIMSKKENEKWFIFEEVKNEFSKLID